MTTRSLEELSADPEVHRQAEDREDALFLLRAEMAKGQEEAEAKGEAKGRRGLLLEQLKRKFRVVPDAVGERVKRASAEEISLWAERILFASSLDEVFQPAVR